jgi:hypothetical protein
VDLTIDAPAKFPRRRSHVRVLDRVMQPERASDHREPRKISSFQPRGENSRLNGPCSTPVLARTRDPEVAGPLDARAACTIVD